MLHLNLALFVNYSVMEVGFNGNGTITVIFHIEVIFFAC